MSFFVASMSVTCLLSTILTFCICILALCNHQFIYRADIVMLIFSFVLIVVSGFFSIFMFLINVFLTILTLVPLCSRACGYNMCVKTIRTRESHRKALKEILPLFILPLPSYIYRHTSSTESRTWKNNNLGQRLNRTPLCWTFIINMCFSQ